MTSIVMRTTVLAVLQAVTTPTWVTVCIIATQLVEDPLIVLSTTALAVLPHATRATTLVI